jgi:predicted ArsR family transcriptional regulator
LTKEGRRKTGANFAELAIALWQEIRQIADPEIRRGLLQRIARRLAAAYADRVQGQSLEERMEALSELYAERRIPFSVEREGDLPVLTALACPYPELAEQDRAICGLERMLFSEVLGEELRLGECRLDGGVSCRFEPRERSGDTI